MKRSDINKIIYLSNGLLLAGLAIVAYVVFTGEEEPIKTPEIVTAPPAPTPTKTTVPVERKGYGDLFEAPVVEKVEQPVAPPPPAPVVVAPPVKVLDLVLTGTILNKRPVAFIRIPKQGREGPFSAGEEVEDGWKVLEIGEDFIIIQKDAEKARLGIDGSLRYLTQKKNDGAVMAERQGLENESAVMEWANRPITEREKNKSAIQNFLKPGEEMDTPASFYVQKADVSDLRKNISFYARQWVVTPVFASPGKLRGIRVDMVKRGSLPHMYGARPGDIITEIDGIKLDTPQSFSQLLEMYNQFTQGILEKTEVNVAFERGSAKKQVKFRFVQ